ncbi:TPA: hypothetical protein ACH9OJ_005012, partial [Escherichia coli]
MSQVVLSKTIKRPLMGVFFLGFKMHSLQKYIKHKYTHLTFFLSLLFFMIFESREDIIKKILSFSLDEVLPFLMFAFFSAFISITIKEKIAKKYPETNDGITII